MIKHRESNDFIDKDIEDYAAHLLTLLFIHITEITKLDKNNKLVVKTKNLVKSEIRLFNSLKGVEGYNELCEVAIKLTDEEHTISTESEEAKVNKEKSKLDKKKLMAKRKALAMKRMAEKRTKIIEK